MAQSEGRKLCSVTCSFINKTFEAGPPFPLFSALASPGMYKSTRWLVNDTCLYDPSLAPVCQTDDALQENGRGHTLRNCRWHRVRAESAKLSPTR